MANESSKFFACRVTRVSDLLWAYKFLQHRPITHDVTTYNEIFFLIYCFLNLLIASAVIFCLWNTL